jgi:hypothetical protein
MQQQFSLRLSPAQAADDNAVLVLAAQQLGIGLPAITGFYRLKQSIDARSRQQVWINLTIHIFINEPFENRICEQLQLRNVNNASKEVLIIGAGPAGLFAALQLIELGIRPIIIEGAKMYVPAAETLPS